MAAICSAYSIRLSDWPQAELRSATAARDAHKEALDLAQRGLADLEAALAREQTDAEESARKVVMIALFISAVQDSAFFSQLLYACVYDGRHFPCDT